MNNRNEWKGVGYRDQQLVTSVATNTNDHTRPRENIGNEFCHQLTLVVRTYLVFKFTFQQKILVPPSTNSFKQILVTCDCLNDKLPTNVLTERGIIEYNSACNGYCVSRIGCFSVEL